MLCVLLGDSIRFLQTGRDPSKYPLWVCLSLTTANGQSFLCGYFPLAHDIHFDLKYPQDTSNIKVKQNNNKNTNNNNKNVNNGDSNLESPSEAMQIALLCGCLLLLILRKCSMELACTVAPQFYTQLFLATWYFWALSPDIFSWPLIHHHALNVNVRHALKRGSDVLRHTLILVSVIHDLIELVFQWLMKLGYAPCQTFIPLLKRRIFTALCISCIIHIFYYSQKWTHSYCLTTALEF